METPAPLGAAVWANKAAAEAAIRHSQRMGVRVSFNDKGANMKILALAIGVAAMAVAQSDDAHKATYIMDEDVKTVLKGAPPAVDQQLKVVDLGKYNLAVGIVHRGPTREGAAATG